MKKHNRIIAGFTALSVAFFCGTVILQEYNINPFLITANASETYGDLTYIVGNNGTIKITDCDESATDVIIPSEIEGIAVTSIEKNAFAYCLKLKSVIIPDSIVSIGDFAFYKCSVLTSVEIPDSVTSIGEEAFACCKLTSVKIPNGVESISTFTFSNCKELTSITIPDSVTDIASYAFSNCENLTEIQLSENLKSIGYCVFKDCKNLNSIILPENVTNIDREAFYGCTNLDEIIILNPECYIYNSIDTISETATICGYDNSTAQKFAEKYNYSFRSLGEIPSQFTTTTAVNNSSNIEFAYSVDANGNIYTFINTTLNIVGYYSGSTDYWNYATTTQRYWGATTTTNNTTTTTATSIDTTIPATDQKEGDINKDGEVNAVDASIILSYYAYLSTTQDNPVMSIGEFQSAQQ